MIVKEFVDAKIGGFPKKFYDSLPIYCPDCNYPMEMSEALTQLHCSNHRCKSKVTQRLVAMANALGVKDMGESRARKFIDHFGITNPLIIFTYEPDGDGVMGDGVSIETSKKIADQFNAKKSFTLVEYVKIAQLPYIQGSASQIFGSYDDLELAYADIEKGGIDFIAEKLSIKKSESEDEISIRALKIYETLKIYKEDLLQGIRWVNIIKTNTEGITKILAVCSDEVGQPFKTKADFYSTVNNLYPNVHVEFGNAVTKKIEYLVWAGANGNSGARLTNKVKKARGYNEQYQAKVVAGTTKAEDHEIKIVTAAEFLEILRKKTTGEE